jgi:hypothetical protein
LGSSGWAMRAILINQTIGGSNSFEEFEQMI